MLMKWTEDRANNVDDRRGTGASGLLVGGGLGTFIIAAIVYFLGGDPSAVLNNGLENSTRTEQRQLSSEEIQIREFVQMLSAENNQTWESIFTENGLEYREPKIVIFEDRTSSGCGAAQSAMGPFYCPADETVYMDMSFFNEMQQKFGARVTEFTIAYVLAHEIGHHVQTILGTTDKVNQLRQSGRFSEGDLNKVSVATELQADFYAGLWAKQSDRREHFLEIGDIQSAMEAAAAVGDDNIQRRTAGYVNQEAFTHGSSKQREEWFMKGYTTGDIKQGNTFEQLAN